MNNINGVLEEKNKCFGCRACVNICPVNAISMQEDEEGFFYPVVNTEKCTNCGLCKKSCPSLNKSDVYNENTKEPECYALMADDETRLVSSSGGAFSLFADWILEQGGYVCGVAFVEQKVQHIIINNKDDMYKLRGSKYVQSDTNTVYKEIKTLLIQNKLVLFTGTPCQVAGLNTYLGKKYDNLYTIDLICHGVPPQKVFDMYLDETLQKDDIFEHANFRDKKAGWTVYLTTTTTTGKRYYADSLHNDMYLQAFLNNMCLRPSCGTCPYTSTQREADITIGDFWAIERFDKSLNDNKGTSVVLLNNTKGQDILRKIQDKISVCTKVPIEYASWYNITLKQPLKQHTNRKAFFRLMQEGKSLKEIVGYCNNNQYDCGILNFWTFKNVGGVLNAFALQKIIEKLGYSNALINYQWPESRILYENSFVQQFANRYLNITEGYYSKSDLKKTNSLFNTFIFGSDCIWCDKWFLDGTFFGDFVNIDKKKISYAPSFGHDCYNNPALYNIKYYLQKFDELSVREEQGVKILENEFNMQATQVLDPTLLLDKNEYEKIIENIDLEIKKPVFSYGINMLGKYAQNRVSLERIFKDNLVYCEQKDIDNIKIEGWLYLINESKLVITSSFHALCFALIFNKEFYIIIEEYLDDSRFYNLLSKLNLTDRIFKNSNDFENNYRNCSPIDWDKVNAILAKEKERSLKWLKDALDAPKDLSKINPADAIIQSLNNKILDIQAESARKVSVEGLQNVLDYDKNYRKYVKYKILKKFVFGKTRDRYNNKQNIYYEKIKSARRIKRGIAGA